MAGEIRRLLEQELAARPAPPIGDLVAESVRQGRRRRRNRRTVGVGLAAALATGAVLLVPAAVGVGLPVPGDERLGVGQPAAPAGSVRTAAGPGEVAGAAPVASAAGEPTVRSGCDVDGGTVTVTALPAAPTEVANCPVADVWDLDIPPVATGDTAPATARGALELLTRLLPAGRTSGYAEDDPAWSTDAVAVQLLLDRGDGPGLIRLSVSPDPVPVPPGTRSARCAAGQICYPLADGGTVILDDAPDDCPGGRSVRHHRADGTLIQLDLARSCGGGADRAAPAGPALTGQEALAVVLDPRWGTRLPVDLVRQGHARFGELPRAGTR